MIAFHSKKYWFIFLFVMIVVVSEAQTLIIATYQYADNNRIANIQPLADHIAAQTGQTVEVKSYKTVHLLIEAIQKNEVDLALINSFGYFMLEASQTAYPMKPYAVLRIKENAKDNYKTAIIIAHRFNADTLRDIKPIASSLRLMLVSPGSTSGNLVPRLAFNSVGLKNPETDFQKVSYGKNHKAAVDSVILDKADIAAVGSTEYFNLLKDSSRAKQIRLLWLSPEIPLGPLLINNRVAAPLRHSIITILLDLHNKNASALEAVKKGWSEAAQADQFIRLPKNYYMPFRKQSGDEKTMTKIIKQFVN
ncbi:PhnD/SsuA/transferrin family substrate-binding protein [Lacibacter sp. H375]|uniref:phosphate/phosphite/phosphonate ABC transporter substrate-binding protein n=1 Tax=Lacibacter sp. H375 TaxID=3133424 RepID=UPI0030C43269